MTPSHASSSILLLAVALLTAGGCASQPTESPNAQSTAASAGDLAPADVYLKSEQATLVVHGMSCPLCATNVDKQLLEVPGVSHASVDMGTGQVRVTFAPKARVTRKQLEDAVYKSGFTLTEVRVP